MRLPSFRVAGIFLALWSGLASLSIHAAHAAPGEDASDRFGGPLNPGDVFPTTMEPMHPLNPAELARSTETMLQFGIQPDGRSLILGLPNFILAISDQTLPWGLPSGLTDTYAAKKYELGYGLSTTDLGLTGLDASSSANAAIGFNLRYLDFQSSRPGGAGADRVERANGDIGISGSYRRFRADLVLLNLAEFSDGTAGEDSLPGRVPKEYNIGLAYGMPSDWLVSARMGIQDSTGGQAIVDLGFEKLFFRDLTFRIGSQRRYAFESGNATREVKSSLSGGVWYRMTWPGEGYHYPDSDADLFSVPTLARLLRDVEVGGLVMLTKTPRADGTSHSSTVLLMTVGKSF